MTATVDNTKSNDSAIEHVKRKIDNQGCGVLGRQYLHVQCVVYIINLIVMDGLELEEKHITHI